MAGPGSGPGFANIANAVIQSRGTAAGFNAMMQPLNNIYSNPAVDQSTAPASAPTSPGRSTAGASRISGATTLQGANPTNTGQKTLLGQ